MPLRLLILLALSWTTSLVTAETLTPATGLAGFYYTTPDFSGPAQAVIDAQVDFDWRDQAPRVGLPSDDVTIRWLGELQAPDTGDLTLIVHSDDGVRVWLDGRLVINDWFARSPEDSRFTFSAKAGSWHRVRIDYFEAKGGATISLSWQGAGRTREVVPTAALRPLLEPAIADLPLASAISPACIVGMRRPDAKVVASVNGRPQRVLDLPETGFYFNARLRADLPVEVGVGASRGAITWTPTVLLGDQRMTLRVDDAILLTSATTVYYSIAWGSGILRPERALKAGARQVEVFSQAGTYLVSAHDASGHAVSSIDVEVVDVDFDGPIANQLGQRRDKGVEITGAPADTVVFSSADESLLETTFKEETDYGARIWLTTRRRGTPMVVARLAGSGAIIATQVIDEFTITTDALFYAVRNAEDSSASVSLLIRPWVPNLTAQFRVFAHRTTFEGGGKELDLDTNTCTKVTDPLTGELCGRLDVQLSIPAGENMYCFKLTMDQHSRHGTPVGSTSVNGAACDFEVTPLYLETGDVTSHPLVVIEGKDNPDDAHHGQRKTLDHKITLDADGAKNLKLSANSSFNCITQNNWRPQVKAAKATKDGRYSVLIDGTEFKEKIIISAVCEFELSATEEKAKKPLLYRVFPGTSVTITATLKKKQKKNDSKTHYLTVTGPTAVQPFEVVCPKEVGQSVSVTVKVYDLGLAAGSYNARILGAYKEAIFTITNRVTLNNHIATLIGEQGSVLTGTSTIAPPPTLTVHQNSSNGTWTTTLTGTCAVTYENHSIVNRLAPNGIGEWSSAERDKAPDDEITGWASCVSHIQQHEQGHQNIWAQNQPPRNEVVTGMGTGSSNNASYVEATANFNANKEGVVASIYSADTARQEAFHGTPAGTVDLPQFRLPGRD